MGEQSILDQPVASDPELLRKQALESLKKRRDFRTHVFAYLAVNAMLWGIWAVTGAEGGTPWPVFVSLGWGVGVAINAWEVFATKPITEADIDREIHRLGRIH